MFVAVLDAFSMRLVDEISLIFPELLMIGNNENQVKEQEETMLFPQF